MNVIFILTLASLVMLAYVYVGYPLFIVLLSRLNSKSVRKREVTPTVSIIISAHNEAKVIEEKILNSLALGYPKDKLEIIVSDDGSSDGTADIARKYENRGIILLSDGTRRGKVGAMNRAVQHTTGEIVVFSDANVFYEPDAIRKVVANFGDAAVGCVVTRKRVITTDSGLSKSDGLYWRYEDLIQLSESRVHSTVAASGHLQALRRNLVPVIPDEKLILDDLYLAMSVLSKGMRVVYEPEAICWEGSSASMQGEVARRRRITASRYYTVEMLWRHFRYLKPFPMFQFISHKILRLFIPFFMVAALLGNALLVLGPDWFGRHNPVIWNATLGLLVAQVVFYIAAAAGAVLERIGRKMPKMLYLPYFLCSTNMASVTGLMWFISDNGNVMWQRVERE
jgi:cellulose synthase/poly-beta-1,6-N-acetylglucosamine synthase-like glycosyltransferase